MSWFKGMRCLPPCLLILFGLLSASLAAPAESPAAGSFYVHTLPGLIQDTNRPLNIFAGHISSDPHLDKASDTDVTPHLYFVLVKNRRTADRPRVMFWFNGGPGCSSFDGLMMENGPWRLDEYGQPHLKEGGWEEYTTMVYVDQPAGTGYSYTSTNHYVHTLDAAAEHFITFLKNFYKVFPEYEYMDTYLGGESYAGQYIPYFAESLLLNGDLKTPLRGVAIGNGWIDAKRQYPSYLAYSVKHGLVEDQSEDWKHKKRLTDECVEDINKVTDREPIKNDKCEGMLYDYLKVEKTNEKGEPLCINMYDIRLFDTNPSCGMNWPPEIKNVTAYLDRSDVVNALHANAHPGAWVECKGSVHSEFREQLSNSSIVVLPRVLEKIPVLIFAGDQDLICNYVGLEAMIQAMKWNGATGLGTVQTQSWTVDGNPAGTWVESRNLTYVKVFNASHMAPYDFPHVAHDMILRFMGVNFSAILEPDGSARIPSSLGSESKPMPSTPVIEAKPSETPSVLNQVYNSGSTFAVVVAILAGLGAFLCWRLRRRRVQLPVQSEEEIPLAANGSNGSRSYPSRKGKERATESTEEIFNVGNASDDEDEYRSASPRPRRMS